METEIYRLWDAVSDIRRQRSADKRAYHEALAKLETQVHHLQDALTATIRALASGETTHPSETRPHVHSLAGQETIRHLAKAAHALNLGELVSLEF